MCHTDLKKTVAVLMENLLDRVHVLEQRIGRLTQANHSAAGSSGVIQQVKSLESVNGGDENSVNAQGEFRPVVYTVNHKERATLFLIITLPLLARFL